ncbi:MAG: MASE3 domain-containing protein [Thermodesulfobacteriota bacterium]
MKDGTLAKRFLAGSAALLILYLTSLYSYPLFHTLVETYIVVIAGCIFVLAWNSRKSLDNNYLLFIGIAYLYVGILELLHMLAYKGMGIFRGFDANLPTQLWIVARYMESLSLVIAALVLRRKLNHYLVSMTYAAVTLILLVLVFYWRVFPDCFFEGTGLTPFKIISEYVIMVILAGGVALLVRHRREFERDILWMLVGSIVLTIFAELFFTFYVSVYGLSNLIGHFFTLISFYLMYRAVTVTGVTRPLDLLFRNLAQSEASLKRAKEGLEATVAERTAELSRTNEQLRRELSEREQAEEALRESEKRIRRKLDAILSPDSDLEALELSDIIDSEKIQKLMDEFYRLTNVGIGIIDLHGNVLVGTGWQDICTKFHRVNPESCRLCIESDLELSRNVPVGTYKQYRCRLNMWDIATPIMLGEKHVGNIFLGQFLFDDETPDYEAFRQQARRYGFGEQEYLAALDRVPRWSRNMVDAAMSFYTAFAGMIGNLSYANIKLARALAAHRRAEEALRKSAEEIHDLYNRAPCGYHSLDSEGVIVRINDTELQWLGYTREEVVGKKRFSDVISERSLKTFQDNFPQFKDRGWVRDLEFEMLRKDGTILPVLLSASAVTDRDGNFVMSRATLHDITERRRTANIVHARLRLLELAGSCSADELLTATLDELEALTGSTIGFYHFLESDQRTLSLQNWSTNTLKNMCTAAGKGNHYDIGRAGVWVDCIHQRGPVIHNDYASLPHRKGMPEGHAPVTREVVVPIFRANLIKAIIGVGNKSSDYDENDIEMVSQLGDLSWDIVERKQAEEALHRAHQNYLSLVNSVDGIVWEADPLTFAFSFVSHQAERLLGYPLDRWLGDPTFWVDHLHPDDREWAVEFCRNAVREKRGHDFEYRMVAADGRGVWLRDIVTVVLEGDRPVHLRGVMVDITERKAAEDSLRRSERRNTILNRIANIFLATPDEEMYGEVLDVILDAMESKLGIFGFIEENGDLVIPSMTREIWNVCQVPEKSLAFPPHTWGKSLWGRAIREQRAFLSAGPFRTPEGHLRIDHFLTAPIVFGDKTIGLLSVANREQGYTEEDKDLLESIASSISPILHARLQRDREEQERKRAEEALRKSNEALRATLEAAPVAIFDLDTEGHVRSIWNRAAEQLLGWRRDEVLGRFLPSVREEDKEEFARFREWMRAGKRMMGVDVVRRRKDGSPIEYSIYAAPEYDQDGKVIGNIAVLVDIRDRKRAEEQIRRLNVELEQRVKDRTAQLEAANKELEAFAYSVSHDLRAPLRHIDSFIELLQMRIGPAMDDRSRHYMTRVSDSARRMGMLIDDLLSFSRMGRSEMSSVPVNLNDLVREVIQELQPDVQGRNIRWEIAELPTVTGDHAMLRIVLVNLISNALKFTRPRELAEIQIGCTKAPEGETVVSVRDNGVGFDMAYSDKLFGVFRRLHRAEEFAGTGIGLATVQRIVTRHGGRTWAEGTVGRGATFYFSLPCISQERKGERP